MQLLISFISFAIFASVVQANRLVRAVAEDAKLTVPELIEKYGYPAEVHHVESEDGYILEMHRIPHGVAEGSGPSENKPVVFVQHGMLSSSADLIIAGPKKGISIEKNIVCISGQKCFPDSCGGSPRFARVVNSALVGKTPLSPLVAQYTINWKYFQAQIVNGEQALKRNGYLLADLGYDVWMGNARGNTYSRKHKTLSPDQMEFWDFSWHEIGIYDVPVMIDYALEKTGQNKTFYIGHSQGTTVFYVMCSEKPEYNSKIIAQFSLAPVAYVDHMTSPVFRYFSTFLGPLQALFNLVGGGEFLPSSEFIAQVGDKICSESSITQFICTNSLFLVYGFDTEQMNTELLPVIMGHTPAGCSVRQLVHYGQELHSEPGAFRYYDWGTKKNIHLYKSEVPPNYNLSKITAPVSLHYSHNDWAAAEVDVVRLYNELPNPIGLFLVKNERFNHLDFLWAKDVDELVYAKVFSLMAKFL